MTPTTDLPCCGNCTISGCDLSNERLEAAKETNILDVGRIMIMRCTTEIHGGCLSHPRAREYINRDAIAELERRIKLARSVPANGKRIEALKEALALIGGGVKA
jgi:predicted PhzF superfamily epimerase YddE/YHI9